MCGICGIVKLDGSSVDPQCLIEMRESIAYRGPDDEGAALLASKQQAQTIEFKSINEILDKQLHSCLYDVGLAHRRLSIIDLSEAGHQPMQNANGTMWITFNGEIYNYLEIRKTLKEKGYIFKSNTDTEVIINAYQEWDSECLQYFNGMFAFAIYDPIKKQIFLARDRAGKKPLYYLQNENAFLFASELKAIIKAVDKQLDIDLEALNFYLAFGYVPGSMCILKGVYKLPPAHAAIFDINKKTLKIWQYWELPALEQNSDKYSINELVDELEYLLEDSVKLRLISDVPLGIFLSGGTDSSLVTAMAARCASGLVRTFNVSFPYARKYDESHYARTIAVYFHTDHYCLDGSENMSDALKEIAPSLDEPIADSSILPTYLISKLARKHITVALAGDGGDELFGGYTHYLRALRDKTWLSYVPGSVYSFAANTAKLLPEGTKGRNWLLSLRNGYLQKNIWGTPYFDSFMRKKIFKNETLNRFNIEIEEPEQWKIELLGKAAEDIDKLTRVDFFSYLPDDILAKVDRASMLNSLEIRAPWLDYRIIEFAFKKVPPKYKIHNGTLRFIQKRLAERLLPKTFNLDRKQGFSIPVGNIRHIAQSILSDSNIKRALCSLFSQKYIKYLMNGQSKMRSNHSRAFSLAMLGLFMNRYKIAVRVS